MFQNRDVICFFGDSITAMGLWMAEVYQELRKRVAVKCYNCGVSGANVTSALSYLQSECLRYNPDYVNVMFGINDIARYLYADDQKDAPDRERWMREAIERYAQNYEEALKQIQASGAKPIVCIPVPYDEVSDVPEKNLKCQRGMDAIEVHLRALAKKYGCTVVDFKAVMQPMLGKKNIMSGDRVHPTPEGHHVMAQSFLRDTGVLETCDFDTPFVFEDWNRARFDAEQYLHKLNHVEFCVLIKEYIDGVTYEEKKRRARALYDALENKTGFVADCYAEYLERIDRREQLLGEVVRLTVF